MNTSLGQCLRIAGTFRADCVNLYGSKIDDLDPSLAETEIVVHYGYGRD